MLPEKEQNGARQLLRMLAEDDLYPLVNTIANKRIVIRSRAGKFLIDDSCCCNLPEASWLQISYVALETYGTTLITVSLLHTYYTRTYYVSLVQRSAQPHHVLAVSVSK